MDMSNLTEEEAEHVLQVVQRDMKLRKTEEQRLNELKQELDQEESRRVLLSRQRGFNERCCICCCSSFTFLLKPRRCCLDCRYNVCKRCCSYSEIDQSWLCSACEKSRLLKTQSLEWFYSNVRRRFQRFGSAKVLKMLYRRHVGEQGSQAELTDESIYAESVGNEDSVYESDSTFYKHSEERTMAETISVALRVAKEAIDDAIIRAECQTDNQEKLKEALYLRDNKGELIEELTTMIVQTIICRKRDQSEMQPECNLKPTPGPNSNNSQSALSLLTEEIHSQHYKTDPSLVLSTQWPKKDCVDWLESSCASSVLQSPDGNWFALQSTQQPKMSLPTKRENLMFSALEKESGMISAYDGMASDADSDTDETWTTAWLEYYHKMSASGILSERHSISTQPTTNSSVQTTTDQTLTDPLPEIQKTYCTVLKRKVSLQSPSITDISLNLDGTESSEDGLEDKRIKRTHRKRKSKRVDVEERALRECAGKRLSLSEPQDYGRMLLDVLLKCQNNKQDVTDFLRDQTMNADTPGSLTPDILKSGTLTPDDLTPDMEDLSNFKDHELTSTLQEQANQDTEETATRNEFGKSNELSDKMTENGDEYRQKEELDHSWGTNDSEENKTSNNVIMVNVLQENSKSPSTAKGEDHELEDEKLSDIQTTNMCIDIINDLDSDTRHKKIKQHNENETYQIEANEVEECFNYEIDIKKDKKQRNVKEDETDNTEKQGQFKATDDNDSKLIKPEEINDILVSRKAGHIDCKEIEQRNHTNTHEASELHQESPEDNSVKSIIVDSQSCEDELPYTQSGAACNEYNQIQSEKNEVMSIHDSMDGDAMACVSSIELEYSNVNNVWCDETEKTVKDIFDHNVFLNELEEDYEHFVDCTDVAILGNIIEETDVYSDMTLCSFDITDTRSLETNEVVRPLQKERKVMENQMMEDHNEKMDSFEPLKYTMNPHNLVNDEKLNCNPKEDQSDTMVLKEVLISPVSGQEDFESPVELYKKCSAASLRSITTEVLKILNATEDLIHGSMDVSQSECKEKTALSISQSKKLDEHLSKLEENVYVTASDVFGLEAELNNLEECARSIDEKTTEEELIHLEEKVASTAAHVQQSELQVTDIAARIAALKSAGLNVSPQTRFAKVNTDSEKPHQRRFSAPLMQGKKL